MKKVLRYGLIFGIMVVIIVAIIFIFSIKNGCEKVKLEITYNQFSTGIFYVDGSREDYKNHNVKTCLNEEFQINEQYSSINSLICGDYTILSENNEYYLIIPEHMRLTNGEKDKKILFNDTISLHGSSVTDNVCLVNMTLLE